MKLYRAKYKALKLLEADFKNSYSKQYKYEVAIEEFNIGSVVDLQRELIPKFQKPFYTKFDATRRGFFQGCRPFVCINGCNLRGPYKEVLFNYYNHRCQLLPFGNRYSWKWKTKNHGFIFLKCYICRLR